MKGAIVSEENRTAGNIILIEIDENNYNPEGTREISKAVSLSGIVLTTDWGFQEGNRVISISNIITTQTDYDILVGMQEESTGIFFLFGYGTSIWKVLIQSISKQSKGTDYLVNLSLSVVSKYTDLESS